MEKIFIIGGGVSGLVAAIASTNNDITLLERNNVCGKKILSTGNGKCNYTNIDQDINHYHSSNSELINKIINENNLNMMKEQLKKIGIIPKIKNGYCYPYSNQAVTFQNALNKEVENKNIKVITDTYVEEIIKDNNQFIIKTKNKNYIADKVIISTGGKAYPKSGSDGNGYDKLKSLSHSIIKPLPALVQLKTLENLKECNGVRSDVSISLYENDNLIKEEVGEIQFTDYGISGICAMQLSGLVSRKLDNKNNINITINFIPNICKTKIECINFIEELNNTTKNRNISELLDSILNYKITNYILKNNHIEDKNWEYLTNVEKDLIISSLINFKLNIIGTNSFEQAQVCSGGVPLTEINPNTMESLKIKNLYIIGELLDVDGDCGGYNLTFAIITGMLAGLGANND